MNLEKIYRNFVRFQRDEVIRDIEKWLGSKRLTKKQKIQTFENYWKISFVEFWFHVKRIVYSESIFDIFRKNLSIDLWDLCYFLSFLKKAGLIETESEKIIRKKNLEKYILPPISRKEIKCRLEEKFGKLNPKKTVPEIIGKEFQWKEMYDQIPLDLNSVLSVIKKIAEWYPFYDGFGFLGDDDFVSVLLKTVFPKLKIRVFDIDEKILGICSEFGIQTKNVDVTKACKIERLYGFYTNPPYTLRGAKKFIESGLKAFSEKGGLAFIVLGPELLNNRFTIMQRYFVQRRLVLLDYYAPLLHRMKINYQEDKVIIEKFRKIGVEIKKGYPSISAKLLIMNYIPRKIKMIRKNVDILTYF